MRRITSLLAIGMLMAAGTFAVNAQVSRWEGAKDSPLPKEAPRGVMLVPGILKHRGADAEQSGPFRSVTAKAATPKTSARPGNDVPKGGKAKVKVAAKATSIQGYCSYNGIAGDLGWYNVTNPASPVLQWKKQTNYNPYSGFVRNGEVFGFYTYSTTSSGLIDAGYYVLNASTGAVKEENATDIFDTLEHVVLRAAYDSAEDVAYVITLNKGGSGYMLQKFDPKSRNFTDLGVTVPSDWLDLGWNPSDNTLYMFDESSMLKKYDSKAKKFTQVREVSWGEVLDVPHDMVYSPKDEAFVLVVDAYDDMYDEYTTDMILVPVTGSAVKYVASFSSDPTYSILYVADSFVVGTNVAAPKLKSWNVEGPATSGSMTLTLPSTTENGNSISGNVYLQVKMDETTLSGSYSGAPGADVTIPVSGSEGLHRFTVTPFTLGDNGKQFGTPLVFDKCFGHDQPSAPKNVKLTESKVTWSAVTDGANGGYVDASAVKYNVYIDKVLMNQQPVSGTELAVTIPNSGVVAHRAEVYALAADKVSEPGTSDRLYVDGALSLPVYLGCEEGESDMDAELINMFTVVKDALNNEDLRGWRYDDQSEHTGGFYCLAAKASSTGDKCNEWLFLPAINFTDKNAHYRLAMEVWTANHYFTSDETYEIAICPAPSSRGAKIIKEATTVYKNPYFETSETLFQVPEEGEWYIGIHYISPINAYRLYARNFRVEKAKASADSPAAVTNLRSVAAADGVLEATLTFNMPTLSISGAELPASTVITATAVSEAGEASVTGAPGTAVSVKVPTVQGDNVIAVTTSSDKGTGLMAETTVYCGVYQPATPIVTPVVSEDNMTITLNVEIPAYNENGEYTGPADQEVTIYRQVSGEWRPAAQIGKERTWSFTVSDPTQDTYSFGVGSKNCIGYCEYLYTYNVNLGKPYDLPLVETFPTQGENVDFHEPLTIEHLSYLHSTWGFADPSEVSDDAANASGTAIYAGWDGESQLLLPRVSTKGLNNVKLDLSLFFGNVTPELITVFATSPAVNMQQVAQYTPESGNGWEHKLISLPAACQKQGWVQLTIRVKITGYQKYFLMDYYKIADYPANMVTISGMNGASRGAVGEKSTYTVEVENAGTSEVAMPAYKFTVLGDNGLIGELTANNAPAKLASGQKAKISFDYTPKSGDTGDVLMRFTLEGQPEAAVSEIDKQVKVLAARVPTVDDLALSYSEDLKDVVLNWTEPKFTEDFEVAEPWDFSENIRGFRNIDMDGSTVWGVTEIMFLGEGDPKAFQVFNDEITDNKSMEAHSGDQYLLCMSPKTGETSDWLISPEVKGGSKISFWMNICSGDYPEIVLVKYSTTGNNVADFTQSLADGYVCPDEAGWVKYEFTLPANAKYFALHHVGDDGNEQFGMMIDDISYEPADGSHGVDGYNVYRDGELIASGIKTNAYTDKGVDYSVPVMYAVKTLSTVNGELVESDRSNVVWATGESSVDDLTAGVATIMAVKGGVQLRDFAAGTAYNVSNSAGMVIAAGEIATDVETVALNAGIYVVKCGAAVVKVIVK